MLLFAAFALGLALTGCSEAKSINPQPRQKRMVASADPYECPPCAVYSCPEGYYPTYEPYMTMSLCSCPIFKECAKSKTNEQPAFGKPISLVRKRRSDKLSASLAPSKCPQPYQVFCPMVMQVMPGCPEGYELRSNDQTYKLDDGTVCKDPCGGKDYYCINKKGEVVKPIYGDTLSVSQMRRKRSDGLSVGDVQPVKGKPIFYDPCQNYDMMYIACTDEYIMPPECKPGYVLEKQPRMVEKDGYKCPDPCGGVDYSCVLAEDPCEMATMDVYCTKEMEIIPDCKPGYRLDSKPRVYITEGGHECPDPCGKMDYECVHDPCYQNYLVDCIMMEEAPPKCEKGYEVQQTPATYEIDGFVCPDPCKKYNYECVPLMYDILPVEDSMLMRRKRSDKLAVADVQPIAYDPCQEYASKNRFCTKEMQIAPECEPGYIAISKPRVFVLDGGQECKDPCGKVDYECIRDPCYQNYLVKCMMVVEAPPECKEGYEVQKSPATYEVDGFVCPEPCRKYNYECVPVKNDDSAVIVDKASMRKKRMSQPIGISVSDDPCYQSYMVMCAMMYVPPPTCPEGYDLLSSPRMYETDSGHLCPQPCSQPIYTCYNKKTDEYCDPIYSDGPSVELM